MAKIFFTGNALSRNQIVTLTDPDQDGYVYITINGYQLFFETWDAEVIAAGINASTEDALDGLTASVNEEGRVLIEGGESIEFVVTMSVQAAVDVEVLTEGRPKKPQITTVALPSTTNGGTWSITVNGQTASGLSYAITADNLKTALEGLSTVESGDVVVESLNATTWRITFGGTLLGTPVTVSGNGSSLLGQAVANVITTQFSGGNSKVVYQLFHQGVTSGGNNLRLFVNDIDCGLLVNSSGGFAGTTTGIQSQIRTALGSNQVYLFKGSINDPVYGTDWLFLVLGAEFIDGGSLPEVRLVGSGGTVIASPACDPLAGETSQVFVLSGSTVYYGIGSPSDAKFRIDYDGMQYEESGLTVGGINTVLTSAFGVGNFSSTQIYIADGLNGTKVFSYLVVMQDDLAQQDLGLVEFTYGMAGGSFTAGAVITLVVGSEPINEIQKISVSNGVGGTFRASFNGSALGSAISFPTSAAAFQAHLESLTTIDSGDVEVTGGTGTDNSPLFIEFIGGLSAENTPPLVLNVTQVTGGSVIPSTPQSHDAGASEVQRISIRDVPAGGDFKLALGTVQSAAIAYNEAASGLEDKLEAMSNIGSGNISVAAAGSRAYIATFGGSKAFTAQPSFEVVQNTLLLAEVGDVVAYTQEATGPGHWRDPKNWSLSRVPECGDDILLEDIPRDSDIRYGLIQLVDFTVDTTTDVCSCVEHDFVAGQKVRLASTSALPSPLAVDTDYFVVAPNRYVGTFQLSATLGGSVINITSVGTGIHSCGVRANSLTHYMSCQAQIGLPRRRDNGNGVREILNRYLRIGLMGEQKILLGRGEGNGSGLIRIDHGRDKANIVALDSAGPAERDAPTINIVGTSDLTELQVSNGASVGYCCFPDESGGLAFIQGLGGEIIAGDVTLHAAMEIRQSSGAQIRCPRLKTASNQVIISVM